MNDLIDLQKFLDNFVDNDLNFVATNFDDEKVNNLFQKSQLVIENFPQQSAGFFALTLLYKHLQKYDFAAANACAAILFADDFLNKNKQKLLNLLTFLDGLVATKENSKFKTHLINFLKVLYDENNNSGKFSYFSLNNLFNQDNLHKLHGNLAFMYCQIGDINKTKKHADLAISYDKFDGYHKSLMLVLNSNMCNVLGDLISAENYARQSIKINPKGDGFLSLGIALNAQGKRFEAVQILSKACEIQANNHQTWERLAWAMLNIGEAEMAYKIANVAIEVLTKNKNNFDKNLYYKTLADSYSLHLLIDPYCENKKADFINNITMYSNLISKSYPQQYSYDSNYKKTTKIQTLKTLKIGFVSGDFRHHVVMFFFKKLLQELQKNNAKNANKIEVFTYMTKSTTNEDSVSEEIKKLSHWRNIYNLDDNQAAEKIRQDEINILFDLSGYTLNHRLKMFALKPAPIQISWIGWLGTTGIPTMDYFLADEFCVPSREKYEQQFSEKVLRMPHIWEVLDPPKFPTNFPREI